MNLSGIVTNDGGKVVVGAAVRLYNDETGYEDDVSTDAAGKYSFMYLRAGTYTLEVYHRTALDYSASLTVEAETVHNVELIRKASISGTVKTAAGAPIRYVSVHAAGGGTSEDTETDASGNYVINGLDAGTYELTFIDELGDYNETTISNLVVAARQQVTGKNATLTPATVDPGADPVDVSGVVKSTTGAILPGTRVNAIDSYGDYVANTRVNRAGKFSFRTLSDDDYTFLFPETDLDESSTDLPFAEAYYPGTKFPSKATVVPITADANKVLGTTVLTQYGAITGTITTPEATPVPEGYVELYNEDDRTVDSTNTSNGKYRIVVRPGRYAVQLAGGDEEMGVYYLYEFWKNTGALSSSTRVTVSPGTTVTGINAQLTDKLEVLKAPSISGSAVVGKTLSANTGTWNRMAGNEYTVSWLRGSTRVATGTKYVVKSADFGKKLSIRVEATSPDVEESATAVSAATAAVKGVSRTTLTGRSPSKGKVTLSVTVSGVSNPGGTVTIKKGSRSVKSGVKVVNGRASITLIRQARGTARFTAVYSGSSRATASTSKVLTVSIK